MRHSRADGALVNVAWCKEKAANGLLDPDEREKRTNSSELITAWCYDMEAHTAKCVDKVV